MSKLQDIVEKWVSPLAVKFAGNKYIAAIKDGMISWQCKYFCVKCLPSMLVNKYILRFRA